jgi:hypothetical protein
MAIDMKKVRARYTTLKNRGEGGTNSNQFWKPEEGEQTVRLVCPVDGDPFKDFWFHYDVGGAPGFLSPKRNFGEDCPLDKYVRALWKDGSDESKRVARKLGAKQRFFAPVVVRGREEEGVKIWGFGKRAYETLVGLVLNPEYGDITDAESGTDLVIKYTKPAGASFPETKITPRRASSPLLEDSAKAAALLESIPDFDAAFASARKSPSEVKEILNNFLNSEDTLTPARVPVTSVRSRVDKAFSELLS